MAERSGKKGPAGVGQPDSACTHSSLIYSMVFELARQSPPQGLINIYLLTIDSELALNIQAPFQK